MVASGQSPQPGLVPASPLAHWPQQMKTGITKKVQKPY